MTRVRVTPCVSAYGYTRVRVWLFIPEQIPHPFPRVYRFSQQSCADFVDRHQQVLTSHNHHHHLSPSYGHLWAITLGDNGQLWGRQWPTLGNSTQQRPPLGDNNGRRRPPLGDNNNNHPLPRPKSKTEGLSTPLQHHHHSLFPSRRQKQQQPTSSLPHSKHDHPLACKRDVGLALGSFCLGRLLCHHNHPLSLTNARWGCFLVLFARNGRRITATTPSRSQS